MDEFSEFEQEKNIPWKPIAIIIGVVVLVILLVIGASIFVRSRQQNNIAEQMLDRTQSQIERMVESCEDAEDPDKCRADRIAEAANAHKSAEICEMIEQELEHDNCLRELARDENDVEICKFVIEAEAKQSCFDYGYFRAVREDPYNEKCDKISDSELMEHCKDTVLIGIAARDGCEAAYSIEYCQLRGELEVAVATQDPERCRELSDTNSQSECIELVGVGDADFDGLDAYQEEKYGSSDYSQDSDGDGYLDKDEVDAGYNPAGEGLLETLTSNL